MVNIENKKLKDELENFKESNKIKDDEILKLKDVIVTVKNEL